MTKQPLVASRATPTGSPLMGSATVPGDKSISHRALMLASLAPGPSTIAGLLLGADVLHTAAAMRQLGASISTRPDGVWQVAGPRTLHTPEKILDMGNSGTACRLLLGLLSTLPLRATFDGDASLQKRPMARVLDPLARMGGQFYSAGGGRLPVTSLGCHNPQPLDYVLPVASAQVKSALLLAALHTPGTTTIYEPTPTRDHTENMLRQAGVPLVVSDWVGPNGEAGKKIALTGPATLRPQDYVVPADPSSAAFLVVAAALSAGSQLTLPAVGMNPRRTGLFATLLEMGARLRMDNMRQQNGERVADLVVEGSALQGVNVPASRVPDMIDEIPILAVAASCARGTTQLTGLHELRVKESDRLGLMAKNLAAAGVKLEQTGDDLVIHGTGQPPAGGMLAETSMDHRIAMSMLVLGGVSVEPIRIDDGSFIATSFPDFVPLLNRLGTNIAAVN